MATARVERVTISDMGRTRTVTAQAVDARAQAQPATHVIRLLGLVGSADEMYAVKTLLEAGGLPAKRLLVAKLEDIVSALSTLCSITVIHDASASSTFNGGAEINALAAYLTTHETGEDTNKSIYPGSAGATIDPGYT